MSSSPATSIPKAPAERTFVFAVTFLSLVAVAQLIAVVVAIAPKLDLEKIGRSIASRPAPVAPSALPSATDDVAKARQANALLDEASQAEARGDFKGALQALTDADRLVPAKAGILGRMVSDYVALKDNDGAIAVLNRIVALPPSSDPDDQAIRERAQAFLTQLGAGQPAAAASQQAPNSAGMRDDVGIPIGSVMGIIKAELLDGDPGQKNLRVATKGASNQKIDSQKFVATVDFYEQDDHSQILHNDSPQVTEWLSLPATWTDGTPEIFQTKYRMPLKDRGDLPPLQYYGYIVAIYYNGELQDSRAEPVSLLDQFPPPLHKSSTGE